MNFVDAPINEKLAGISVLNVKADILNKIKVLFIPRYNEDIYIHTYIWNES